MKKFLFLIVFFLFGCEDIVEEKPTDIVRDQCLRIQLYQQCMKDLPKGPEVVGTSNDWDEVIGQCDENARYQSARKRQHVKPECAI